MTSFSILILIFSFLIARYAQRRYESALPRGRQFAIPGGQTAGDLAREFLDMSGAPDVRIMKHDALVSDYLDAPRRCLYLNESVMNGTDAASLAIAMHEAGHAVQGDASGTALNWRIGTIRLTRYLPALSVVAMLVMMAALHLPFRAAIGFTALIWMSIAVMSVLSLPIEFNASRRALAFLERKMVKQPRFVQTMTGLLRDVAYRDTGVFVRSPTYCLFGLMPVGGKLRPTK